VVRNIPAFSRFLHVAAQCNAKQINLSRISNDAQVARTTLYEYFRILEDTLIGSFLPAWAESEKRKPIKGPKFYFFDTGVVRTLQKRGRIELGTPEAGELFETFLCHELRSYLHYEQPVDGSLHYWRSTSGFEVDFILDNEVAIETKLSATIGPRDLKGLNALREEQKLRRYLLVCLEPVPRTVDGLEVLPYQVFLEQLWTGRLSS